LGKINIEEIGINIEGKIEENIEEKLEGKTSKIVIEELSLNN
jgi:hypothetical protein